METFYVVKSFCKTTRTEECIRCFLRFMRFRARRRRENSCKTEFHAAGPSGYRAYTTYTAAIRTR